MPLSRRLIVAFLAVTSLLLGWGEAEAVCNQANVCSFADLAGCCPGTTCTLDGTISLRGPTCDLNFSGHNVVLTGTLAVGSTTVTIEASSFTISGSGLVDAHGTSPNPGGNVTITTTDGATSSSVSLSGTSQSGIDLTGYGVGGGSLEIHAMGAVSLTGGRIDASSGDPNGGENGGSILIDSKASDLTVGIPISADAGVGGIGGDVRLTVPGNVTVTDSGKITVLGGAGDAGDLTIDAGGKFTITGAGILQANGLGTSAGFGGSIDITAGTSGSPLAEAIHVEGTIEAKGGSDVTGAAGGDGGSVSLEAISGALVLLGTGTNGIHGDGAGGGGGAEIVSLTTDSPMTGDITISAPVSAAGHGTTLNRPAGGGQVEVSSAKGLTVTKLIDVSGVDGGTGTVDLIAARDVSIQRSIRGDDETGGGDFTVQSGHDIAFTSVSGDTIRMNGTTNSFNIPSPGGSITLTAGNEVRLTGFTFSVSGSSGGQGGRILVDAGGRVSVDGASELNVNGSKAGTIALMAGVSATTGVAELPGDLQIDGNVFAMGHDASGTAPGSIQLGGCQVTIGASGRVDSTGDAGSSNTVIGRTGITINGRLRATTGSNTAAYMVGITPTITGPNSQVSPAFPNPPAGEKPLCTQKNPASPAGCLMPCPACGNGGLAEFPEDCDPPTCPTCDIHCRTIATMCDDGRDCTSNDCDPIFGCVNEPLADGTLCDDHNPCTTPDACSSGVCTGGPARNCSDGNVCTVDSCDPASGCVNAPVTCQDTPCFGPSTCAGPGGCRPGPPVSCGPGLFCNRTNGLCEPKTCAADADCDDGNFCTDDTCDPTTHHCTNAPRTGAAPPGCDDGNVCNGVETCVSGVCTPGTPLVCDDGNVCTLETGCDKVLGCQHTPIPGCCHAPTDCPGSNVCTMCAANACGVMPGCCLNDADCNDGNECTDDSCSQATHQCRHVAVDVGTACGDACNPGTCLANTCDSTPVVCTPDSDPCTDDFCDPAAPDRLNPCVHRHRAGCCQTDVDCNDQDACTRDTCESMQCFHTQLFAECKTCSTDQDCAPGGGPGMPGGACAGKRCQQGVCRDVAPPNCDNAPPNFTGMCVLDSAGNPGCVNLCVNQLACDDHNVCNGKETCAGGACVPGTPLDCNDHNLCTDDTCDPAAGCRNNPKTGYAGVRCQLDTMDAALNSARPSDISASVRGKITGLMGKVRAKLAAGETIGQGKRALKQLTGAGKQLKAIGRAVQAATRGRKKKIEPTLADMLINAAAGGGAALDNLKASITP